MITQASAPFDFAPPSSYALEPELYGPPPRMIPDQLRQGSYTRSRKTVIAGLVTLGVACLLARGAPGLDTLAQYVLPLGYLGWIGLAALAIAAAKAFELARNAGPFRYVREGIPLTARVVGLAKAPSVVVNGVPSRHAFTAGLIFKHPESRVLLQAQAKSSDFPSSQKDRYDTPFKVGDYVTAVYLPGKLEKTLQVYAFLELNPQHALRRGGSSIAESPAKAAALALVLVAFFAILVANVYAFGRYEPLDFDYSRALWPMIAGGIVLGGGMLAALYLAHRQEQAKIERRAREALATGAAVEHGRRFLGSGVPGWVLRIVMALGAPLLGAVITLCWCFMANALLDTSEPRRTPVKIERMTMTTHAFLFREYELEYALDGSSHKQKLLTTPEHLHQLRGHHCEALVRAGRLGWPWVDTVVPLHEDAGA